MKKHSGFTLIEIMISLLIGLIIVGATLTIFISTIKGSSDTVKSARLNYDLESTMQFMVNDIRRAGYWGGAITGSDAKQNPFTIGTADIQLLDPIVIDLITFYRCILYTYDADGDGVINNGEYYGFKLDNETIKVSSANTVDDTGDCTKTDSRWENILDSDNIKVTALTFSSANSQCLNASVSPPVSCITTALVTGNTGVQSREIQITLTGQVTDDTAVEKILTGIVKVRNNRIFTQ